LDDVVDFAGDAVDAVAGVGEDLVDAVVGVADAAADLASDVWDGIEDAWDETTEFIEESVEKLEEAWDDFVESAGEFFESVWEGIEKGWDAMVDGIAAFGEWVGEQLVAAVDWLKGAAEWVLEEVVKPIVNVVAFVLEFIEVFIGALLGLALGIVCTIISKITGEVPEQVRVLEAIADGHHKIEDQFKIKRMPLDQKYVVFSDIHIYHEGEFDFYGNNGNAAIHKQLLKHYSDKNFHLIDNGDIEDFWMEAYVRWNRQAGELILESANEKMLNDVSDQLPYPYYSESFRRHGQLSARQVHALRIFKNHLETYAVTDAGFASLGKYTRIIGNHDDVWHDPEMSGILEIAYPSVDVIEVYDYVVLEGVSGYAAFVIAHGHQSDGFNREICSLAGRLLTNAGSWVQRWLPSLGKKLFTRSRSEWAADLAGYGLHNDLDEIDGPQSMDERDLYEEYADQFGSGIGAPHLVLGHTHQMRHRPGVPAFMYKDSWNWDKYTNTGTTGMWEGCVTCVEIVDGMATPVMWYRGSDSSNGGLVRDVMSPYRYGEVYLK